MRRANVINDARPGIERGAGDGGFHRVNRKRDFDFGREFLDDRNDAAQFLILWNRLGAGPSGFPTDVENIRAFFDQSQRVPDRRVRVQKFPAVGKRIGRDVDNAHDQRWSGKYKLNPACVKDDFVGGLHKSINSGIGPIRKAPRRVDGGQAKMPDAAIAPFLKPLAGWQCRI